MGGGGVGGVLCEDIYKFYENGVIMNLINFRVLDRVIVY